MAGHGTTTATSLPSMVYPSSRHKTHTRHGNRQQCTLLGDWVVHWQPHVGFGYPTCSSVLPLLPQPQHKARSLAILAEKVLIVLGLTSLLGNGESGRGGRIKEWHWVGEISNMSFANNNSSNRRRINCSGLFICFFLLCSLSLFKSGWNFSKSAASPPVQRSEKHTTERGKKNISRQSNGGMGWEVQGGKAGMCKQCKLGDRLYASWQRGE